jgi:hypothetical protein
MEKTCNEIVHDLLIEIQNKPGLYIGTKSITKLKHFLDGFLFALYVSSGKKEYPNILCGFQEWIEMRYDITSTHNWSNIINFYSNTESDAFDIFYKHLDEFLSLNIDEEGYKNLLEKKEKWLELKSDYWKKKHELYI